MKSFIINVALMCAVMGCVIGIASIANAADLEAVSAGESTINGCYVDQMDGTWIEVSGDHQICTYDGTYAIITGALDVCGSGSQQWYHNFGTSFDSADMAALTPSDWTNNFYASPAPELTETTCTTPPAPSVSEATSSIEQVQQNMWYSYFAFLFIVFFVVWLFKTN